MREVSLILDVGNGSIGVALVDYSQSVSIGTNGNPANSAKPTPLILYSHREPLTFLAAVNEERLLAAMLDLLKTVLGHVQKEAIKLIPKNILSHAHFKHVVCVFSSPWYVSQTSTVTKEADAPFRITNALVNELVNKEEVRFAGAMERGEYEKYFGSKIVLLERALVHTAVNGYEVANPVGKHGRSLEVTLFTSLISEKVLHLMEDVFYRVFHVSQIECFSYALASWNAVRTIFPEISDFIFLDVSGETSDVTIAIRGTITETVSFPFGRATILRALVDTMRISPETALSFVKMRAAGTLEKGAAATMENVLRALSDQWTDAFNQTLSTISKKYNLPKRAFVTIDLDLASFFSGILNRADIGPALFKGPFDVTIIGGTAIAPFVSSVNQSYTRMDNTFKFLPGATDPSLALETIFFGNKIH